MQWSSKLAEHTRLEMWVFMVKQQSSVTPRLLVVRHQNRCTTCSHSVWEGGRVSPRLSTRRCNHCFGFVVTELHLFTVIQVFMCGHVGNGRWHNGYGRHQWHDGVADTVIWWGGLHWQHDGGSRCQWCSRVAGIGDMMAIAGAGDLTGWLMRWCDGLVGVNDMTGVSDANDVMGAALAGTNDVMGW